MSTIFGVISSETPKYTVLQKHAAYEIRKYGQQIQAQVEVEHDGPMSSNLGGPFRMLAGYIFGGNTKRAAQEAEKVAMTAPVLMSQPQPQQQQQQAAAEKVAMTAPVMMSSQQDGKGMLKMAFIMPSKYSSLEELPLPKDARVKLVEVPEHQVAVIRFSGSFVSSNFQAKEAALRQAAQADGVKLSADPSQVQVAGYNPPWCLPWLKTNEVMIPVLEA